MSLIPGPVCAAAATATAVVGAGSTGLRIAAVLAGLSAGGCGAYDDLAARDSAGARGLAGHLGALRSGTLTGGSVKLVGISAGGVLAGLSLHGGFVDALITGGLVAGTANLLNLLDVRPGRALKSALLLGGAVLPYDSGMLAGPMGAAAALLGDDVAERGMLGDTGANTLGALLGLSVADALDRGPRSRQTRLAALALVTALIVAGDRVSFTAVIDDIPVLRSLDRLGRRAAPPAGG